MYASMVCSVFAIAVTLRRRHLDTCITNIQALNTCIICAQVQTANMQWLELVHTINIILNIVLFMFWLSDGLLTMEI